MSTVTNPASPYPTRTSRERDAVMLQGAGWIRAARLALWIVVATASVKVSEIIGLGEQSYADVSVSSPLDLAFRLGVLAGCAFATFIALAAGKIRIVTLWFVPFCIWAFLVTIGQQSSFSSSKQLGSYASWILFFIAATALFDQPEDFRNLRIATVLSVIVAAIGGIIEHLLGHAPMIGMSWENAGFTRMHTGAGGILLDAGAPYIAAMLLLVSARKSPLMMFGGMLIALWGSGNILREGMIGFIVAIAWLLTVVSKPVRRRLLMSIGGAVILVSLTFGGKLMQKSVSDDDEINTSGRIEHWPQLIGWIREEPIWGHGPNADMELLEHSDGADLRAAHNELLSTAVNFGLVGTILLWCPLLLLLLVTIRLAYHHRKEEPEPLWGAGAVLLMLIILSFTDNTLRTPGIMILALSPVPVAFNWCFRRQRELGGNS